MNESPQNPKQSHFAFTRFPLASVFVATIVITVSLAAAQFGGPDNPSGDLDQANPDDTIQGSPRRFFVDDDAALMGDGKTWATAFRYLQDGLRAARLTQDVEVRVARGIYRPDQDEAGNVTPGDPTASFNLLPDTTVAGGFAGQYSPDPNARDIDAFETILTGDLLGNDVGTNGREDNSHHVVTGSNANALTVLEGVTVRSGASPDNGGGLNVARGIMISRCRFENNSAVLSGGGVSMGGGTFSTPPGIVRESVFENNWTDGFGGGFDGRAAAVIECRFRNNSALDGGGIGRPVRAGGGFRAVSAHECVFQENSADDRGGGVFILERLSNCLFVNNTAREGGGCYFVRSVSNSTFVENHATEFAGGADARSSRPIENCVFANNSAGASGGGAIAHEARRCMFVGNTDDSGSNGFGSAHLFVPTPGPSAAPRLFNSIIEGGWNGVGHGNWDAVPMFVDPDNGDYRFLPGSPGIDAGSNGLRPVDVFDLNTNGEVNDPVPFDLDGASRTVGCRVDIGAYEFQGSARLYGDIDDDCDSDLDDYALFEICMFLSGPDVAPPFQECVDVFDDDGDGDVDLRDAQRFMAFFSPMHDPL